jgi:hypothetical protein
MMKLEVKEKLIKALRSGEYKQTTGQLKDNDCFCVNGVLCDIAAKDGIGNWNYDTFIVNERGRTILLPFEIAQWASDKPLDKNAFAESIIADECCLMGKNDAGMTFPELAEMVESAEEVYFHYKDEANEFCDE